jgi:alginate O-acetyltransferase complex protein AlgI
MAFFRSRASHLYLWFVLLTTMAYFRANDMTQASAFHLAMLGWAWGSPEVNPIGLFADSQTWAALAASLIAMMPSAAWVQARLLGPQPGAARRNVAQVLELAGLTLLLVICMMKLASGTYNPFIYFRF